MHSRFKSRTLTAAVAVAVAAAVVAGCGSSTNSADAGQPASNANGAGANGTKENDKGFVLKIAAQDNYGPLPYAEAHKIFEKALAPMGVTVKWVPIQSAYSTTLAELRSGDINLERAPMSAAVATTVTNVPVKVFMLTAKRTTASGSGILVPKGSPIQSVKDLAGKSVVVNPAAKGEFVLLRALQENGVPIKSVKRVDIQPPDAAPAFSSGKIQAWATFGTFYDSAVDSGARVLVTEKQLDSPDQLTAYVANTTDLEQHPAVFEKFISVYNQLADQVRANPAKYINVLQKTGPTAAKGADYQEDLETNKETWDMHAPGPADNKILDVISNTWLAGGVIPKPVTPDEIFTNALKDPTG